MDKDLNKITVKQEVLDGIKAVRDSGETNMFSFNTVQYIAHRLGFLETVLWMEQNKELYIKGIFHGFCVEGEENG